MSQAQTCPVYGQLNFPNFQGLPPIPLCCNPSKCIPQCVVPQYTVVQPGKRSLCQLIPEAPYNESFILANLPLLTFLLITAIPRFFFCLLYDVGLTIVNITKDVDKFIASLLDILVAPFLGFADGASYGGCAIIEDIISFFTGGPKIPPPSNQCPFRYTFNTTLQNTLELIGFAIGSVFGLINTFIGFLIDGVGIALCYLTNLTINFGVCFDVFGIDFNLTGSVSPFTFLNPLNFMNCACVLGQTQYCPTINAVIGNCPPSVPSCTITNAGCPGVPTPFSQCIDCDSQCLQDVYTLTQAQQNYCNQCYQSCKACCNGNEDCINSCQQAWGQCNNCVSQLASCLQGQCAFDFIQCLPNNKPPPNGCNPNVDYCEPSTCCFPDTDYFSCPYSNYGCATGSGCTQSSSGG